jgi:hypothetical protein
MADVKPMTHESVGVRFEGLLPPDDENVRRLPLWIRISRRKVFGCIEQRIIPQWSR